MKYIRTQGGIYEVIEETFKPMENNMVFIPEEGLTKILNQANAIKELCDAYVIKNPENNRHHFARYESLYELQTIAKEHTDLEIYGAIWTEKGLIYVAKMNKEGKLWLF